MATIEMIMPQMGESIIEATVLSWLKKEGDLIEQDESVLEVATDKVDTEVPTEHAGVLKEILAKEGDVIAIGRPIAIITINNNAETTPEDNQKNITHENVVGATITNQPTSAKVFIEKPTSGRFYSPLVLNIARKESIPMAELDTMPGTGKEGRVTKKDILSYLTNRNSENGKNSLTAGSISAPTTSSENINLDPKVSLSIGGEDEIIEMDRMRKIIAQRMIQSKRISAHVTSFVEADLTKLVKWRNKVKREFNAREGDNLTFTPLFIEAVVKAIKDYPMINISVDGDNIIKKKDINIGMAVALPTGNLIVPIIHNADQYNLSGLTKKVNDLARRARSNKLSPDELTGGTFTISNVGSFGNVMGTPIIVQPQVGIMAFGTIVKKPAVIETPEGDVIGIRHKMFLSHSYDHRVVDGALGGMVARRAADYLENFDIKRTI